MNNPKITQNEDGFVLVASILILMVLVILGVSTMTNSNLEVQIGGNDVRHKLAFFAAESGRSYVEGTPGLWGDSNLSSGVTIAFPDATDPTATQPLGTIQSYNGSVGHTDQTAPPRGSGYEAEKFAAINYQMNCTGNGPANSNAVSNITAGFYRIGFKTTN